MSKTVDLSVVIGIDRKTLEQANVSIPTWRKNRPDMWFMPWVVFYDPFQLLEREVDQFIMRQNLPAVVVPWENDYETQREKMLSGFVHVPPRTVETQWWMKVDTDALAFPHDNWLEESWFEPDADGVEAEYIASSWGYTKAKGGGGDITEWANNLERWGDQFETPRLGLEKYIDGQRINYKRMCSWVSYYNTEASKHLLEHCEDKLPVPSQDTLVWYYTARRGGRCIHAGMKRRGWTNTSKIKNLRIQAEEILNG